jgi:uncharacterized protein
MTDVLYVAAKAPVPGRVKTRLAQAIGENAATALYRAFLLDLAGRFPSASWYVTPLGDWKRSGIAQGRPCLEQPPGDWTERQRALFHGAPERDESRVVLIASDSPQLLEKTVAEAFALLDAHELVLGPVADGGYYLIGMRGWHDVLRGVAMSTGSVLDELLRAAQSLSLSATTLAPTYDVDEVADLELLAYDADARDDLAATRAVLDGLRVGSLVT